MEITPLEHHILVLDDDDSMVHMLTFLFEDQGYFVVSANNGLEGLKLLKEVHIDLVITDIIMPGMEGIEFIRTVRRDYPNTKIVAMSGFMGMGQLDYLNFAKLFGVDLTFQKPFDVNELVSSIKTLLIS